MIQKNNTKNEDVTKIDWGLKILHNKLLEMLIDLHNFCVQHDIEYCLAYGSALGAVRHGGFIPWDDDVDIYMDAYNYDLFEKAFSKYGNKDKYYLQNVGKRHKSTCLSKIRMNGTTFIEPISKNLDIHHGIYIDVFVLHDCPNVSFEVMKKRMASNYLSIKRLSNLHYSRRKLWRPILALLRFFPSDFGREKAELILSKHDGLNYKYYFDSEYKANSQIYPKKLLFPAKKMSFQGATLKVPRHVEKYLTIIYGDYMNVPSKEQIEWSIHAGEWYVDKDFREILKGEFVFKDEVL